MSNPERMTIAEVAELLGVCAQTVYDQAARCEIPHHRIGRRLVFSRVAVMDWFRSQRNVQPLPATKAG